MITHRGRKIGFLSRMNTHANIHSHHNKRCKIALHCVPVVTRWHLSHVPTTSQIQMMVNSNLDNTVSSLSCCLSTSAIHYRCGFQSELSGLQSITYLENTQQNYIKQPVGSPGLPQKGSGVTFFYYVLVKLLYLNQMSKQQKLVWIFRLIHTLQTNGN